LLNAPWPKNRPGRFALTRLDSTDWSPGLALENSAGVIAASSQNDGDSITRRVEDQEIGQRRKQRRNSPWPD
jgi:hypothetical protein